jgi:hypothetical protein
MINNIKEKEPSNYELISPSNFYPQEQTAEILFFDLILNV